MCCSRRLPCVCVCVYTGLIAAHAPSPPSRRRFAGGCSAMSNTRKPPASPSSLCLRYCVPDWARWPDQPGSAAARGLVMRRVGRATPPRTSGGRASSGGTRSPLTRGCRPPAVGCRSHNLLTAARPWPLLRTPSRGVHCSDEVGRSPEYVTICGGVDYKPGAYIGGRRPQK